ncbi:HAD family hydrolase [Bifidobacterium saguinibicoloris]|uniref:HAD family hydrolase n=1 Tax=Bifidobacterium saguinibicoloris TaxID=2834433 RepID=UPI001C583607|nr:HAD family phosphatase [Bifidobacterium saguinibicoloris]MBW3080407.1 HAD family phosphatase [Bifidobacterium saguinibicoloris]
MKGWPGERELTVPFDEVLALDASAAHEGAPIRDVIFDFGNVLVDWDPEALFMPRYSHERVEAFLDNDVSGFYDACDRMDCGMSPEDGIAWMRETHGERWAEMLTYYFDNFLDSLTGTIPGMRVLVDDVKAAGLGVWGLSNWQSQTIGMAEDAYAVLRALDGRVISGEVRLRKPDKAIYRKALETFSIDEATAVFVDDRASNVIGANRAGLRCIRFRDERGLRQTLITAGVPIPQVAD